VKQKAGLSTSTYKIPTGFHHTRTTPATATNTKMYQSMASPYSDSTSAYETHGPADRLEHLVHTYGVDLVRHSPIFKLQRRFGLPCAALLVCFALIMSVYVDVTFGYGVYSYGFLSNKAADNVMVFLLIVVVAFLWVMARIFWVSNSVREVSGLRRHSYMLGRQHAAKGDEGADEEVIVVERQDTV